MLQVHVRASSGEGVLKSPHGVRYDNQLWYNVDVFRIGGRVDIRVNGEDIISGEVIEVNSNDVIKIDLGVFLGGFGRWYLYQFYF